LTQNNHCSTCICNGPAMLWTSSGFSSPSDYSQVRIIVATHRTIVLYASSGLTSCQPHHIPPPPPSHCLIQLLANQSPTVLYHRDQACSLSWWRNNIFVLYYFACNCSYIPHTTYAATLLCVHSIMYVHVCIL
jgi:hypothetical protein